MGAGVAVGRISSKLNDSTTFWWSHLGDSLKPSVPQFPSVQNGNNDVTSFLELFDSVRQSMCKSSELCPGEAMEETQGRTEQRPAWSPTGVQGGLTFLWPL